MTKNKRSGSSVPIRARSRRAGAGRIFVAQAVGAVALPYVLLLPMHLAGWIDALQFAAASVALSIASVLIVGHRLARSLRRSAEKEHRRAIEEVHRIAHLDALTELPNRARFRKKLAETIEATKLGGGGGGGTFAVMVLDLDHFKRINETLGHSAGDDLLRVIAQRLVRSLRPEDIAASTRGGVTGRDMCRQGGDEFIVFLNGVASEADAGRVADRLLVALGQPITLGAQDVFVSASIGIVLYPRDGEDVDTLLKNADVAMYVAKTKGRSRFEFYDQSMRAGTEQRLSLEYDLRKALENEEFELYYQPQIDVSTGSVVGIEALIRWHHPTLGLLKPADFISVAEQAGLIMAIWEWVMVSALIQHNAWLEQGLPAMTISVNLSTLQFTDRALVERVREIADVLGVPLDRLELEVTESVLLVDVEKVLKTLTDLRALGVKIAIDDFGTGYSSLAYLRRLPVDKLKLDRTFTFNAQHNEGDVAITRAILAMAKALNLSVVAEGVETPAQVDMLTSLGCTTVQGFLLGEPLPASETATVLRRSLEKPVNSVVAGLGDGGWRSIIQPRAQAQARGHTRDDAAKALP